MRKLILCGDIHGEFKTLVWTLTNRRKITNADVIVLGDFGVGFDNTLEHDYKHFERRLEESNITIYALRGNHDDPSFFSGDKKIDWPRLKFLEDHKVYNIANKEIYVIGGANSTDITWRLDYNKELEQRHKNRRVWWEDEDIVRKNIDELPKKVDVILSHEAPLTFLPPPIRDTSTPMMQYEKIVNSRKYLDEVLKEINTKYWFYGHYHKSYSGSYAQVIYRGLDIMELFEL